jgi:lipopolysaccharide/colanic/teichoic acid biosynthesis glycosyltransferase
MYQSYSLGAPEGAVDLRAPLGGIRKKALDIALTSIALVVLAPILLTTAALVRLLVRKSALATDECIGFGGKRFIRYQFCSAVDERANPSSALLRLNDLSWVSADRPTQQTFCDR